MRRGKDIAVVRALASHQCRPGSIPGVDTTDMWVEFVVGSRPCFEGFSPGSPVFSPSTKTNITKFQFGLKRTVTFEQVSRELSGTPWINKLLLRSFLRLVYVLPTAIKR